MQRCIAARALEIKRLDTDAQHLNSVGNCLFKWIQTAIRRQRELETALLLKGTASKGVHSLVITGSTSSKQPAVREATASIKTWSSCTNGGLQLLHAHHIHARQ